MTASRYDLLPPNATTLERDLSRVTSSLVRAGAPVPTIRTAKRVDIPDSVVPWLVFEYGLAEILPYLTDQRAAIEGGVQWQRIRGTPAAILQALGWLNLNGEIDESEGGSYRWAEFQIGLDAPTSGEAIISQITAVARLSAPVRSRLQRIYSVYDFRRFVLDDSLLSDGAILSDHSGVRPRPDWPQISYGQILSSFVSVDSSVSSGRTEVIPRLVEAYRLFRYDQDQWDEGWHPLSPAVLLTTQEGVSAQYEGQIWGAFSWLQNETWPDVNVVVSSSMTTEESDPGGGSELGTILLHMDGSNNSTVFANNGTSGLAVTAYDGAKISTAQSKWGGASAEFDGVDAYLQIAASEAAIGAGDFTIECWFRTRQNEDWTPIFSLYPEFDTHRLFIVDGQLYHMVQDEVAIPGPQVSNDVWYYVAVTRAAGTVTLFLDGNLVDEPVEQYIDPVDTDWYFEPSPIDIGRDDFRGYLDGFVDEFRLSPSSLYAVGTDANAGKMVLSGTNTLALPTGPFPDA
jgi:P2-related tail formation protein